MKFCVIKASVSVYRFRFTSDQTHPPCQPHKPVPLTATVTLTATATTAAAYPSATTTPHSSSVKLTTVPEDCPLQPV